MAINGTFGRACGNKNQARYEESGDPHAPRQEPSPHTPPPHTPLSSCTLAAHLYTGVPKIIYRRGDTILTIPNYPIVIDSSIAIILGNILPAKFCCYGEVYGGVHIQKRKFLPKIIAKNYRDSILYHDNSEYRMIELSIPTIAIRDYCWDPCSARL